MRIDLPDGSFYYGESKENKPHGLGTLYYTDGSKYLGKWKEGKKHGEGTLLFTNRKTQNQKWIDGQLSEESFLKHLFFKKLFSKYSAKKILGVSILLIILTLTYLTGNDFKNINSLLFQTEQEQKQISEQPNGDNNEKRETDLKSSDRFENYSLEEEKNYYKNDIELEFNFPQFEDRRTRSPSIKPDTQTHACIMCDGTGRDFCLVCDGTGNSNMACYMCNGSGLGEFGMSCMACRGKGFGKCSLCLGRGTSKCMSCGGRGFK